MNQPKSLKSLATIGLNIKPISERYLKEKQLIQSAFGSEISSEIAALEIEKNQLTVILKSLACYNKVIHQKSYWLSEIKTKLQSSKLNIFDFKLKVENAKVKN